MKRISPLERTGWLRRTGRLGGVSKKQARKNAAKGPIRLQVFERDGFQCRAAFLGWSPCFGHLTPHHIVKESQGGEYSLENLASLCAHHNSLIESTVDFAVMCRHYGLVKSADRTFQSYRRDGRYPVSSGRPDGLPPQASPAVPGEGR